MAGTSIAVSNSGCPKSHNPRPREWYCHRETLSNTPEVRWIRRWHGRLVYGPVSRFTSAKLCDISLATIVIPAKAGIQLPFLWIPAFTGKTDRVSSHLRDTRLAWERRLSWLTAD